MKTETLMAISALAGLAVGLIIACLERQLRKQKSEIMHNASKVLTKMTDNLDLIDDKMLTVPQSKLFLAAKEQLKLLAKALLQL